MSGNPETAPNVAAPPKRSTIHSEDHSLAAGRTTRGVIYAVRVRGDSPHWIRALKGEKGLRDVGLDERYSACFPYECDELDDVKTSDPPRVRMKRRALECEISYVGVACGGLVAPSGGTVCRIIALHVI